MPPAAGRQVTPSAEVNTSGPGSPTASHPDAPWVTPVSAASREPGRPDASAGADTRAHEPPGCRRQIAGSPSALPTATCTPPAAAMALTASSGTTAPGMPASGTGRTGPPGAASTSTACWPVLVAAVEPAATTAPPGATAGLSIDSRAAVPSGPVGVHTVPAPALA